MCTLDNVLNHLKYLKKHIEQSGVIIRSSANNILKYYSITTFTDIYTEI